MSECRLGSGQQKANGPEEMFHLTISCHHSLLLQGLPLINHDSQDLINDATHNLIKDLTDCDSDCVVAMFHWGTHGNIGIKSAIKRVVLLTFTCEGCLKLYRFLISLT